MTRAELLQFLRRHRLAVQSTVGPAGPQAAVIGVAFTDSLQIVFDTLSTSRKLQNLRRDPRIALVVGWDQEQTAQIEGVARELTGAARDAALPTYFAAFPDGPSRQSWPDLVYVGVEPRWARFSDFSTGTIVELTDWPSSR